MEIRGRWPRCAPGARAVALVESYCVALVALAGLANRTWNTLREKTQAAACRPWRFRFQRPEQGEFRRNRGLALSARWPQGWIFIGTAAADGRVQILCGFRPASISSFADELLPGHRGARLSTVLVAPTGRVHRLSRVRGKVKEGSKGNRAGGPPQTLLADQVQVPGHS